jgi:hypothetical protein
MALTTEAYNRYLETLKMMAASRTVIIYCVRNLNRAPEATYNNAVYKEIDRLSNLSHDSINEIMSKILMALLSRAEVAEEEVSKITTLPSGDLFEQKVS